MTGHVLILGGGGAVGRHIATGLSELGHDVTITGRSRGPLEEIAARVKGVRVQVGDATDPATFGDVDPDLVVNATARPILRCSSRGLTPAGTWSTSPPPVTRSPDSSRSTRRRDR